MTLIELIERIAPQVGLPKTQTKAIFQKLFDVIAAEVLDGRDVKIQGFGKFKKKHINGGKRVLAGKEYDAKPRDTLAFKSYV